MRKLIIETTPAQTRAALLVEDEVSGLWLSQDLIAGVVFLAQVKTVDQRLQGVFLEAGLPRDGFLSFAGGHAPAEGEKIVVQMKRPALGEKGALFTRDIVVETPLMKWRPQAGKRRLVLARELSAPEERSRLQTALDDKGFKGELTLRGFTGGMAASTVSRAFTHLRQGYDNMQERAEGEAKLGPLLAQRHPAVLAFLHFADAMPQEVRVSGADAVSALKSFVEAHLSHRHIEIIPQEIGLFEQTGAEEAVENALLREVPLAGGGRLVFDEAEAMTVIDVDVAATEGQSKRGSIIRVCAEALPMIIRQIKLRQIGGQVMIDFPALAVKGGGQLASALKEAVRQLPGGRFGRIDQNGLAVLILPRREVSLLDQMTELAGTGPVLGKRLTTYTIAAQALRRAMVALAANPASKVEIIAAPEIVTYLEGQPQWFRALSETYGARVTWQAEASAQREWIDVREC